MRNAASAPRESRRRHEEDVARGRGARASEPARAASLLDLDPDLAEFLPPDAVVDARRALMVRVARLSPGLLDLDRTELDSRDLGLLLLDGLLARELLSDDVASLELLGPGDVLRPWQMVGGVGLLRTQVRWSVLAEARLAVLDRRVAAVLARYPDVYSIIVERLAERAHRLAMLQAICQLNRVDRRLLTLLWHLAERWGRVTPDGTLVPLTLTHRMLAQLVGARRPTVSAAVGNLTRRGELLRNPDGTWLLTGEPVGEPNAVTRRRVPPRRGLLSGAASQPADPQTVAR